MERLDDWQTRLEDLIDDRWSMPFELGRHDCYLFAADCVQAVTGRDIAADIRGYDSEVAAGRILVATGGLRAMLNTQLGDEIPIALAQVGDVGLHEVDGTPAAAVCAGVRWLAAGREGVGVVPDGGIIAAWRCA